jgi:4'-phosphopantetheinyl transferase
VGPVSLWLGRVATVAAQAAAAGQTWLSDTERTRLDTLSAPQRRAQFLAGRWGARHLMAAVHGGDALADWCLQAPHDAPPRLSRGRQALHVAISHSGDHVACAISAEPVGLDLEVPRRPRDIAALCGGVCTAAEQARLRALPLAQRADHFYRMWTLKEAWLKRRAEGVSPARLAALHTQAVPSHEAAEGRSWQQGNLTLAVLAAATLAVEWHGTLGAMDEAHPEHWRVDDIQWPMEAAIPSLPTIRANP